MIIKKPWGRDVFEQNRVSRPDARLNWWTLFVCSEKDTVFIRVLLESAPLKFDPFYDYICLWLFDKSQLKIRVHIKTTWADKRLSRRGNNSSDWFRQERLSHAKESATVIRDKISRTACGIFHLCPFRWDQSFPCGIVFSARRMSVPRFGLLTSAAVVHCVLMFFFFFGVSRVVDWDTIVEKWYSLLPSG